VNNIFEFWWTSRRENVIEKPNNPKGIMIVNYWILGQRFVGLLHSNLSLAFFDGRLKIVRINWTIANFLFGPFYWICIGDGSQCRLKSGNVSISLFWIHLPHIWWTMVQCRINCKAIQKWMPWNRQIQRECKFVVDGIRGPQSMGTRISKDAPLFKY